MLNISIIILALFGFFISLYIYVKKRDDKPLLCPIGADCDSVVRSKYSKIGCVPLEILGGLYYLTIALATTVVYLYPSIGTDLVMSSIFLLSAGGFVAALCLLSIQAFIIRTWCTWCICSAIASITIFVLEFSLGSSIAMTILNLIYLK